MPSVVSVKCSHQCADTETNMFLLSHKTCEDKEKTDKEAIMKNVHLSIESLMTIISKEKLAVTEMFNVVRLPSKEVIVAVLSDLDRTYGPGNIHGVPVAYGLSGYSLTVQSMRSMMENIICECYDRDIAVKALSTDGQFYRLAVRDKEDKPLTLLQLVKDTWEKVKKVSKAEQVQQLMEMNFERQESYEALCNALDSNLASRGDGSIREPIIIRKWANHEWPVLYNPRKLKELMKRKDKKKTETEQLSTRDIENLPSEAADMLSCEVLIDTITGVNPQIDEDDTRKENGTCTTKEKERNLNSKDVIDNSHNIIMNNQQQEESRIEEEMEIDEANNDGVPIYHINPDSVPADTLNTIIAELSNFDQCRKKQKWKNLGIADLKHMLSSEPLEALKSFNKSELVACGLHFKTSLEKAVNKQLDKMTKVDLANGFSAVFGTGVMFAPKKSPPKLRAILKDYFSNKMPKEALNAITATRVFLEEELPTWREHAAFKNGTLIGDAQEPYIWYSQPKFFAAVGEYIVYLLDFHHLFVNARSFVCQNGISGLGVARNAWKAVAEASDSFETGLNRAMVIDLIDRQSNAIAQIVFGEKVEEKMTELGWLREAKFCRTIREWYKAEDEAGLSPEIRQSYRMNMRNALLGSVNLADFPPPGSFVAGMPVVMFEGILTNIDRRCQLHALVPGNSYNVRAPNTLVVENLFSSFQELDPKSTGVLLPDDIPHAIETASYLIQTRLNPERYSYLAFLSRPLQHAIWCFQNAKCAILVIKLYLCIENQAKIRKKNKVGTNANC